MGYLTLSLVPRPARELFHLQFGKAGVDYGVNVRFPAPVSEAIRIRGTATFLDLRPTPTATS
jgi:acyl dehydratase